MSETGFNPMGLWTPPPDLEALVSLAKKATTAPGACLRVAEVGSWAGGTALAMIHGAAPGTKIFCIDHWKGNPQDTTSALVYRAGGPLGVLDAFCKNTRPLLGKTVFPMVGPSDFWAKHLDGPFDLVFIDAEHTEEACGRDIDLWLPKIRPNGVICGHDYDTINPGVLRAVDRRFGDVKLAGSRVWWTNAVPLAEVA
jgi:hypothetical protein